MKMNTLDLLVFQKKMFEISIGNIQWSTTSFHMELSVTQGGTEMFSGVMDYTVEETGSFDVADEPGMLSIMDLMGGMMAPGMDPYGTYEDDDVYGEYEYEEIDYDEMDYDYGDYEYEEVDPTLIEDMPIGDPEGAEDAETTEVQ